MKIKQKKQLSLLPINKKWKMDEMDPLSVPVCVPEFKKKSGTGTGTHTESGSISSILKKNIATFLSFRYNP